MSATMRLFLVIDYARWGVSRNVVQAESAEAAQALVTSTAFPDPRVEVEELKVGGVEPRILWCEDESPDTGPDSG